MDFYSNAEEQLRAANSQYKDGMYRTPVANLFLACELFLKSLVEGHNPDSPFLDTHDILNLAREIDGLINFKKLSTKLGLMRKYHNDSRYPFNPAVYTKEFYDELLQIVLEVKSEIDKATANKSTKQVLEEKFGKGKVTDIRDEESTQNY